MSDFIAPPRKPFELLTHNLKLFLPAAFLFLALLGLNIWQFYQANRPATQADGTPLSPAIEEKFGVRFMGIHVLGKGGLVDVRYRVIDAGKAKNFGHYTETAPMLIDEDNGQAIEVTIMGLHNHRVEAGRVYYVLFRNINGTVKPGDQVTIQIGDLALEHLVAQ